MDPKGKRTGRNDTEKRGKKNIDDDVERERGTRTAIYAAVEKMESDGERRRSEHDYVSLYVYIEEDVINCGIDVERKMKR